MAEGNNHAELKGSVAGQTFTINTKDVISVLLILSGLLGGYLVYQSVDHDLDQLYARQQSILDQLHAMDEQRIQQTIRLHHLLSTHEYNQGRPPEDRLPLVLDPPIQPAPR